MGGIAAIGALMSGIALGGIGLAMGSGGGRGSSALPSLGSKPSSPAARSMASQEDSALTSQFQTSQMQNTQKAMSYNDQPNRSYVDNPNRLRNIINAFNSQNQNQNGQ